MGNNPVSSVDPDGGKTDDPPRMLDEVTVRATRLPSFWQRMKSFDFAAFGAGFINASVTNQLLGAGRISQDNKAFEYGQFAGDVFSALFSIDQMLQGGAMALGGGAVTLGSGGTLSLVSVPAMGLGLALTAHGATVFGTSTSHIYHNYGRLFAKGKSKGKGGSKRLGSDIPSWAKGKKPNFNEKPADFAKRLLNDKYGAGNYKTGPRSEYNKLKKYAERL